MVFKGILYAVLTVCGLGLVLRFVSIARQGRIFQHAKETVAYQLFAMDYPGAFFNTLLQVRLLRAGWGRWLIHTAMVAGFVYLVLVHALDDWTGTWFSFYQPGIAPFRFLRNLAGLLAMAAGVCFLVRRLLPLRINLDRRQRGIRFKVRGTLTIFLILGIMATGFLTEGLAIISQARFEEMVEEYSDLSGDPELIHLAALWQRDYQVVFDPEIFSAREGSATDLDRGQSLNEDFCLTCHQRPDSAFVSSGLARLLSKGGALFNSLRLDRVFYWTHFGLVMILLACLPFSRMFHLAAIPLATARRRLPLDQLCTQMGYLDLVGLSACTHCGFCSQVCSVYPDYQATENPQVLPHVKLETVKRLAANKGMDLMALTRLRSGNDDCTRCGLCADICPSGIDLVRLWTVADHLMDQLGCQSNYAMAMEASFALWTGGSRKPRVQETAALADESLLPGLMKRSEAFEHCVQCTLCTNTCPVVAYDLGRNDMGPHQIMNLLRLGQQQMASGTRMVWHCLTCYACQEVCPQSIRVADILLELRCQGQKRAAELVKSQLKGEVG